MTSSRSLPPAANVSEQPQLDTTSGLRGDWRSKYSEPLFIGVLCLKVLASPFLGSAYLRELFAPFINAHLAIGLSNPWAYFYENGFNLQAFPYHPVMLWVFTVPRLVFGFFFDNAAWQDVGFGMFAVMRLPLLAADLVIYSVLATWFVTRIRRVVLVYWCSPVIFYTAYYHGQLDLVPTALLMLALYRLFRQRFVLFGITLALAIATKSHVLVTVPFLLIYLARTRGREAVGKALTGLAGTLGLLAVVTLPYWTSAGFQRMVMQAPEQLRVFDFAYPLAGEHARLLFAPAAALAILLRFG